MFNFRIDNQQIIKIHLYKYQCLYQQKQMQSIIQKYNPSLVYTSEKAKPIITRSNKSLIAHKFSKNNNQSTSHKNNQPNQDDFTTTRKSFLMKGINSMGFSKYETEKHDGQYPAFMDPSQDKQLIVMQQLSKLQGLWSEHNIPSFYYYYFLQIIKKKTIGEKHQLILKEIKNIQQKKNFYYFKINQLVQARENVYTLIIDFIDQNFNKNKTQEVLEAYIKFVQNQSQFYCNAQVQNQQKYVSIQKDNQTQRMTSNELDTIIKHIKMYRMLTMKIIYAIFDWQKWVKYHEFTQPVQFLYRHEDYLLKISQYDTNKIGQNILFQKNPYFLMKKEYERKPWKILYSELKCDPKQSQEMGKTLDILAFHTSRLLKYKLVGEFNNNRMNQRDKKIGYKRKMSSIKKHYRSEVKIPPNYLERKHPIFYREINPEKEKYVEQNEQAQKQKDVEIKKINHKPSIIIGINSFRAKPSSFQNTLFKNKIQALNDMDKKKVLKPEPISDFKLREKDFDKIKKVNFSNTERKLSTPPVENNPTMLIKTRYQKQEQTQLELQYVQLQQTEVLEFLEDILIKLKSKNSSKMDFYLRTILSNKESILIKVCSQDKVVGLIIATQERAPNYKQFFTIKQLIKIKEIKSMQNQIIKYLSSFNKYYQLKQADQTYELPLQIVSPEAKAHIKLKLIFQNDKKWKKQSQKLSNQNPNLYTVYKNRNSSKHYYQQKDDQIIFKYELYFDKINEVKIINKNSVVQSYYKIKADKAIKLNLNNQGILGYRLIFYGIKDIIEVYFPENHNDEQFSYNDLTLAQGQGQQTPNIDVLIPTGSTKYQYMSNKEQKILFHQYIKINNKNTIPLSLIRHEIKYKGSISIRKPFIMKILDKSEQIYTFCIKE